MSEEKEWDIKIETQEDAQRMARIGGNAGLTYAVITTLLIGFALSAGLSQMVKLDAVDPEKVSQQMGVIIAIAGRCILYCLLAWRTKSAKGLIAAPLLLIFIVAEILMIVFAGVSNGVVPALLLILLAIVVGFVLLAGVKGNWANRAFRKGLRV